MSDRRRAKNIRLGLLLGAVALFFFLLVILRYEVFAK